MEEMFWRFLYFDSPFLTEMSCKHVEHDQFSDSLCFFVVSNHSSLDGQLVRCLVVDSASKGRLSNEGRYINSL
jgi:hypothetical protein